LNGFYISFNRLVLQLKKKAIPTGLLIPGEGLAWSGQLGGCGLRRLASLRRQLLLLLHQVNGREDFAPGIPLAVVVGRDQMGWSFRDFRLRLGAIGQSVLEAQRQVVLPL